MQVRGALLGSSEKTFRGTLDFLEGAKGSVGRENEEVVLLSPTVRNRSVPIMLSHEDDVDGHHAVSIGKMDEEKLFYLMSRGLDLADAQRLVVEASFNPVLDRIPDEALKTEIDEHLQRRLSNG
jgi:Fe-S cluster assembly scaffold protein SufB